MKGERIEVEGVEVDTNREIRGKSVGMIRLKMSSRRGLRRHKVPRFVVLYGKQTGIERVKTSLDQFGGKGPGAESDVRG